MAESLRHVAVAGAGIIGASIAWHLAKGGARVTVFDAGGEGGSATPRSWAWINASWGNPEPYFRLRTRSMDEWRRLDSAVPGLAVDWCGGLIWDLPPDELERFAAEHASWGYDIRRVGREEIERMEPALARAPDFAFHVPGEGAVEPADAVRSLLADAARNGASIRACGVDGLVLQDGRVTGVRCEDDTIEADAVVLAAGAATAELASAAGVHVPLTTPPGLLVSSEPLPKLLNGLVMAPQLHVRQTREGRLLAGTDFGGADPGKSPDGASASLFAAVQAALRGGEAIRFSHHTVGYRPTPADGFPIVGAVEGVEGLYLAVTHSGVTLAPALGAMLAAEVLHGACDPLLAPYRLQRFGQA